MSPLTIFKYKLGPVTDLELPIGAQVLSVANQREEICLWALIDMDHKPETRRFYIFGTGHKVPDDIKLYFIGTVLLEGGSLVLHVFEQLKPNERLRSVEA